MYQYPLTQGSASTGLRTIMAYPYEGHPFKGVRNFWSNPRMTLPESGTALGVEGESDNAAVLTNNTIIIYHNNIYHCYSFMLSYNIYY